MSDLIQYKDTPQILEDFANELKTNLKLNLSARRTRKRYRSRYSSGGYIASRIKEHRSRPKQYQATKELNRSINYKISLFKILLEFNEYGVMLDRGTDGVKLKQFDSDSLLEDANIDYGSMDKMRKDIRRWVNRRGLKLRERSLFGIGIPLKNTPANRNKLEYLIVRSIYNRGLNATFWFTRPFKALAAKLPENLIFGIHKSLDKGFDNIFL